MSTLVPPVFEPWHLDSFGRTWGGNFAHRVEAVSTLLRHKDFGTLFLLAYESFFGEADMILLRMDLNCFRSDHFHRYALKARHVEPRDAADFFTLRGLTGRERRDAAARILMLQAGIQTCYVVEDNSGTARYIEWLIPFSESEKLHRAYGNWYPELRPDEAIVEHAYALPKYRGTGFAPCAASRIFEIAREEGVRSIVTFIPTWNKRSLGTFTRLGFKPFLRRRDRKFFGIRFRRMYPVQLSDGRAVQNGHHGMVI